MLEIARLTMTGPRTLLLDEPSVGLMPKLVDLVYAEIAERARRSSRSWSSTRTSRSRSRSPDYVYVLNLGENSHHGPQQDFTARLEEIIREWL